MDYCQILGVPRGSTLATCQVAFRALAKVHHPDRGGSAAAFARVGQAWAEAQRRAPKEEAPADELYRRTGVSLEELRRKYEDAVRRAGEARTAQMRHVRFNGKDFYFKNGQTFF